MSKKETKFISHGTFLKLLALFTMAHEHHKKSAAYEKELAELLELDDGTGYAGMFSDEIYDQGNFNIALKGMNVVVRQSERKK